ncbi:MAG: winged helix-turn-helix transcriptional regulator [Erysipelotrichaceae bacterium]|jgi:DNA-binding MarR family transcriptional regulator|nr:winged helix-turn-helix transcriptional regulator [Erysipelotrichaceae bacterium]MCR5095351.1 MarR family winged helix-turn-helix transcriptional regulator [Erysipelotrichaceae bacterium]
MERSIIQELRSVEQLLKDYLGNDAVRSGKYNLTQYHIIGYLLRHDGEKVCQKDLEKETGLKKASITGSIDNLVEKGTVIRVPSTDDRRKNYIYLTDKVLNFRKQLKERENLFNDQIKGNIPEADKEAFFRVMDQIKDNIRSLSENKVTENPAE